MTQRQLMVGYFDSIYAPFIEELFNISSLCVVDVYNALVDQYGSFVVHIVSKHNKVTQNYRSRDIAQEMHLQLQQSHVVEKFFDQVRLTMPETISGEQARRALGISWVLFQQTISTFVRDYSEPSPLHRAIWMPFPVEGDFDSPTARYRTADIMRLDDRGYFRKLKLMIKDHAALVMPPTPKHFQHYLAKSVHNRFKNFCRSEDRHNRERIYDHFPEFRPVVDDPISWESRLPDTDSCSQERCAELSLFMRRLERTPAGALSQELFLLLEGGYALVDAIDKLNLSPQAKRLTKREIDPWIRLSEPGDTDPRRPRSPGAAARV